MAGLAVVGSGAQSASADELGSKATAVPNVYDVTAWRVAKHPKVTAASDIGAVINDILKDIKKRQQDPDARPGAVIVIPPGDYDLRTTVVIDISFLTIAGHGHGFTSLSIRFNSDTGDWMERQPGGSHVRVLVDGPGFLVRRNASPRLSGIVFRDFCLDGVGFKPDQNSYFNGRTGIEVASDNDALHITGMGFVYLEHGLIVRSADALRVHNNMIAECGSCLELLGAGQATLVSNNLMGAGPHGKTILAENHEGLLVTGNNLFPRGESLIELRGCTRSSIASNRLQGFYPGMLRLVENCKENLVTANHLRRGTEGFPPFLGVTNGLDDLYGVLHLQGDNNLVSNNFFAFDVPADKIVPTSEDPTMILVAGGDSNVMALNHVVSNVAAKHVVLDSSTTHSKVLDSGSADQVKSYSDSVAIRPTP